MWILCVYTFIVVVGEALVIVFGLYLDRIIPTGGLSVSLSLFFAVLWLGWLLAVRWTQPETKAEIARAVK